MNNDIPASPRFFVTIGQSGGWCPVDDYQQDVKLRYAQGCNHTESQAKVIAKILNGRWETEQYGGTVIAEKSGLRLVKRDKGGYSEVTQTGAHTRIYGNEKTALKHWKEG